MTELDPRLFSLMLFAGYVDVGTGQVIASTIGPILAGALTILVGFFGFFLIRFKKVFKLFRNKLWPKKESSS